MNTVQEQNRSSSEDVGPVPAGRQSFHFLPYCSEKWNAEGLRSDRNASNRTVPFQKLERLNWNVTQSLRSVPV